MQFILQHAFTYNWKLPVSSKQDQESRSNDNISSHAIETTPSPASSTGLASAVADLAEHQHRLLEASHSSYANPSLLATSISSGPMTSELNLDGSLCMSPIRGLVMREDRQFDHWSVTAERGASASSSYSEAGMMHWNVPEGFEEQMRLALAVSLAEARARAGISGWCRSFFLQLVVVCHHFFFFLSFLFRVCVLGGRGDSNCVYWRIYSFWIMVLLSFYRVVCIGYGRKTGFRWKGLFSYLCISVWQ